MPIDAPRMLLVSANKMTNPYPVFPLGVAYLQAALEKAGNEVRIWDQLIHSKERLHKYLQWADAIGISMRNVDNVSSTSPVGYMQDYVELLAEIRSQSQAPIIAGGSAFSIFPEEMLEILKLDWGILGEAEDAISSWLTAVQSSQCPRQIPGLVYRTEDGEIRSNPTAVIPPGRIPSPRPDGDWIKAYLDGGGMLNTQTQRGCALRCTYCTYPWIEGKQYRHRSPEDIVAELVHLEKFGTRYVFFTDSVFNTSPKHVKAVCEAILRSGLRMDWGCFARPKNLSEDLLDQMIEAGMKHIEFGSDSFCQETLKSYGKSFSFEDIMKASECAASRNVHACHYIIFGGPGETESTIKQTVQNSNLLPDAPIFAFSGMRIYPHTPLIHETGVKKTSHELIDPTYYTPDSLAVSRREKIIREATAGLPNWFLSDHSDETSQLTARLRKRGKQGPLWEYLAISRRMA